MDWIKVENGNEIPTDKSIIVEDENGCIGQAFYDNGLEAWLLETFGRTEPVYFDKIERYFVIPD